MMPQRCIPWLGALVIVIANAAISGAQPNQAGLPTTNLKPGPHQCESTAPVGETLEEAQAVREGCVHRTTVDPTARSPFTLPAPQITLETASGDEKATATIGVAKGTANFLAKISTPLGTGQTEVQPLTLTGLADGTSVSGSFSKEELFRSFTNSEVIDICRAAGIATTDCTLGKLRAKGHDDVANRLEALVFRSVQYLWALDAGVSSKTFSFTHTDGSSADDASHTSYAFGGAYGVLLPHTILAAVNYHYKHSWKPGNDHTSQICQPVDVPGRLRCDETVIGDPKDKTSNVVSIEVRWRLDTDRTPGIGFAPHIDWDDSQHVTVWAIPVFLFQEKKDDTNKKGGLGGPVLNGGFAVGRRSDTGFQASVFIGTQFSVLHLK